MKRRRFINAMLSGLGGTCLLTSIKSMADGENDKSDTTASNAERTFVIESRYLNFPVKTGANSQKLKLLVDSKVEREFIIDIVDTDPDWWAFMDVGQFQGKSVTLQVDEPSKNFRGLLSIVQSDFQDLCSFAIFLRVDKLIGFRTGFWSLRPSCSPPKTALFLSRSDSASAFC